MLAWLKKHTAIAVLICGSLTCGSLTCGCSAVLEASVDIAVAGTRESALYTTASRELGCPRNQLRGDPVSGSTLNPDEETPIYRVTGCGHTALYVYRGTYDWDRIQ